MSAQLYDQIKHWLEDHRCHDLVSKFAPYNYVWLNLSLVHIILLYGGGFPSSLKL